MLRLARTFGRLPTPANFTVNLAGGGVTVHSRARFSFHKPWGEVMTYQVLYGDTASMAGRDRHLDKRVRSEQFSTEHEALRRARELLEEDPCTVVAIHDRAGNYLHGVRLQLKLGI